MSLLIAEIGNNHFGNMQLARELVKQAHLAGADLIKGQAFVASDIKTGSMTHRFYETCALSEDQYIELIEYARELGSDMFYSIFSPGFTRLKWIQKWQKLAASQTLKGDFSLPEQDNEWTIVSFPSIMITSGLTRIPKCAWALYATPYLPVDPELHLLADLAKAVGGPVGLSDHNKSFHTCLRAIRHFGVNCIEKHFTLQKDVCFDGIVFRDTVHGATPRELEVIANALH